VLALCFLLLSTNWLWARAGGGHSSSSSNHSSGGSSSSSRSSGGGGGGDLFELIRLFWWLNTRHPLIGLPITAGLIYATYRSAKAGKSGYQGAVIKRGNVAAAENLVQPGLRALRKADPAFAQDAFERRVRVAFEKLQRAWCQQSLVTVRPFISDGIHERFGLQFEEQHALGYRPVMENLSIAGFNFAQVECGPVFDVVTVRFSARALDYRVDAASGQRIPGSEEQANFAEFWSFLRTRGSQTKLNQAGLIEGQCPNCGAGIEMNQGAKCEHCQALLRSGDFDWVLAEITQEEEWRPRRTPPPGTVQIRESDPGFNLQDLEDVTSVIFWRKAAAERAGRADALRKVSEPTWCDTFASTLDDSTPRKLLADYSVSAVDTIGVLLDEADQRALVQVWWMARDFTIDEAGRLRGPKGSWLVNSSLFVLARRAGVQSVPQASISSAHCPSCGAALQRDTSNACEYCQTVLNDGTRQWVLRDVFPAGSSESRALIAEAVSRSQRSGELFRAVGTPARSGGTAALAWMILCLDSSGGELDGSIRGMLNVAGKKHGLGKEQIDALLAAAAAGQLDLPQATDAIEAQKWIAEMATAAHLTNGLSRAEEALLLKAGTRLGLAKADVNLLLNRARSEAFATSRDELRTARRDKAAAREESRQTSRS
jgi:predicted nucleic acid-binding Zn ribbon protein